MYVYVILYIYIYNKIWSNVLGNVVKLLKDMLNNKFIQLEVTDQEVCILFDLPARLGV